MLFKNKDHELNYNSLLQLMKKTSSKQKAIAYLLALDPKCFEHCREMYDFHEDNIIVRGLEKAWQTLASRRTTRLAFNLYNGYFSDGETYIGSDGFEEMLPSRYYTPYSFFACEDAPYYVEALKIRYPKWFPVNTAMMYTSEGWDEVELPPFLDLDEVCRKEEEEE